VCQAMTGSGGWPLTVLMTPDQKPFFAGTYFPKKSSFGRIGLMELAKKIKVLWETRREELLRMAEKNLAVLKAETVIVPGKELGVETLERAFQQLTEWYDEQEGGFGYAPKFPTPHNLCFLMRYWKRTGQQTAWRMVERTLTAMRYGGIYDQIGFGFHRYSTDNRWFLPHFE
ncbi:MAG TPA: thioredoxin domain-containing protein, partial [Firmicutes bacterium]|nr:thioredoxin domain-containing protein [Bacillota bacterium]